MRFVFKKIGDISGNRQLADWLENKPPAQGTGSVPICPLSVNPAINGPWRKAGGIVGQGEELVFLCHNDLALDCTSLAKCSQALSYIKRFNFLSRKVSRMMSCDHSF